MNAAIYFLQCDGDGPIKIGATQVGVVSRLTQIQAFTPHELFVRGVTVGDFKRERAIKRLFERDLIRSEWFRPSPELVAFIEQFPVPVDWQAFDDCRFNADLAREVVCKYGPDCSKDDFWRDRSEVAHIRVDTSRLWVGVCDWRQRRKAPPREAIIRWMNEAAA